MSNSGQALGHPSILGVQKRYQVSCTAEESSRDIPISLPIFTIEAMSRQDVYHTIPWGSERSPGPLLLSPLTIPKSKPSSNTQVINQHSSIYKSTITTHHDRRLTRPLPPRLHRNPRQPHSPTDLLHLRPNNGTSTPRLPELDNPVYDRPQSPESRRSFRHPRPLRLLSRGQISPNSDFHQAIPNPLVSRTSGPSCRGDYVKGRDILVYS